MDTNILIIMLEHLELIYLENSKKMYNVLMQAINNSIIHKI